MPPHAGATNVSDAEAAVAPHRPQGRRRHHGVAVPRGDDSRPRLGAGRARQGALRGDRNGARLGRQHGLRHQEEHVGSRRRRPRVRPVAERARAARAVPRAHHDHQQHRRAQRRGVRPARNRRRPLPLERRVPDPVAPEADAGVRPARRHFDRPDFREEVRAGHADPVDAAVHRERRPGGRLLLRLLLRLHRLDQLGVARRSAADGARPARHLRSAVRRRRDAGGAQGTARRRSQHPRLARHLDRPHEEGPRRSGSCPARRLPRRRARDRAADPEGRGVQQQRRAARAAGGADWRARLVLRARQADVRPAGAGVRVGHHARVRLQARTRRQQPRLSGERLQGRVPLGVPPPGEGGEDPRLRQDQPVPRQHGSLLPREAEEHAGRRRHAARQLDRALRIADGRLERAQPQTGADVPGRPRGRRAQGEPAHQGGRRDADGQRDAGRGAEARSGSAVVRRQHGGDGSQRRPGAGGDG